LVVAPGALLWQKGRMQLHVGTATLRGNIRAYAHRFDLLELRADRAKLPRNARLKEMASEVPAGFVFSLLLPKRTCAFDTGAEAEQELSRALEAAATLDAGWLVIQTEPSVMPSTRNARMLAALVEKLPRERKIAWEPRGLWEAEQAERIASDLGLVLVRDVSREPPPPGAELYTRLRALGRSNLSLSALERTAEAALDYDVCCVVMEGDGAVRAAKSLRELVTELSDELGAFGAGATHDDDSDVDEDLEDEPGAETEFGDDVGDEDTTEDEEEFDDELDDDYETDEDE